MILITGMRIDPHNKKGGNIMKRRTPVLLLIVALVLVIAGSFVAKLYNTSMNTVDVDRISFETERGTLSGLLYLPEGASESDPRPTVVVTHGYLNSAEMQDANAIELSRRGYVVLALDMYDHGHSKGNEANTGAFFSFWPYAQYDAACYMYQQPYVLKDEAGNGIIGVTGHSMGGFSSAMAMFHDENAFAEKGYRTIYASLTEGSDYQWSSYLGLTPEVAAATHGGRIVGKLAAQYDEFFFNADGASGGTVVKKDFVSTSAGKTFLEQEAPEAGVWYETSDGGKRIVYQPAETHPWNHFSKTSTGHAIDFYNTAFEGYNEKLNLLPANDQIWLYKELAELVALIGLMLMVVPVAMLLMNLPFFAKAKTGTIAPTASVSGTSSKIGTLALMILCILLPGILFPTLMDKNLTSEPMMFICDAGAIFALIGLAAIVMAKGDKKIMAGGGVMAVCGAALVLLTTLPTYGDSPFWSAPTVNQIAYWTIICTMISALIMSIVYIVVKAKQGLTYESYGLKACPMAILAALCTAVVTVIAVYAVVFIIDLIFKTDFRIWVFAFKTFELSVLPAALRYMPTFILYYIVSSAAICINTNTEKLQGVKGYLVAILLNAGGITVYLIRQYGTLFATGAAAHPTQALSSILLVAMVPTLAIAACFSRALYKRTGNIFTPAFLNGILMTVMTVANTCIYYQF